jgi:hypothetical protein
MNKTLIALSAAALFGSVSASLAYEAPENKIGDRYPALEQTYTPTTARTVGGTVMPRVWHSQTTAAEAPENKIGDRFPALEQAYQPVAAAKVAVRKVMHRQAMYGYEAPENKIGDRFLFLEQTYAAKSVSNGHVMAVRINKHAKKV